MEFINEVKELGVIVKEYLKSNNLKAKDFAGMLGVKPSYLSRLMNKRDNMPASTMIKILGLMGYRIAVMTKKEKNMFEKEAYAEIFKEMKSLKSELKAGVVSEIKNEIFSNLNTYFDREMSKDKIKD